MIQVDKILCPHNHVCPLVRLCPVGAIIQNEEGYPVVDNDLCIDCGVCLKSCPMRAMKRVERL